MRSATADTGLDQPIDANQARKVMEREITDPELRARVQRAVTLLKAWRAPVEVVISTWLLPLTHQDNLSDDMLRVCVPTDGHFDRVTEILRFAQYLYRQQDKTPRKRSLQVAHAEQLRTHFLHAYHDVDVIILCIADWIAQRPTDASDARLVQWAQTSLDVYLPLLNFLGMWQQRRELGNDSLRILQPDLTSQLERAARTYFENNRPLYEPIEARLHEIFEEQALRHIDVQLHQTSPFSLHHRIEQAKKRGETFQPDDLAILRVDVLLNSIRDCYYALGLIHREWRPAHRSKDPYTPRFRDNIAVPLSNGYRCLLTTVLVPNGSHGSQLVEFRLRTYEMDEINTHGVTVARQRNARIQNVWWTNTTVRRVLRTGATGELQDRDEIAVFLPSGDVVYPVKSGSTALDLAFMIHSELAAYTRAFYVNGAFVKPDFQLRHRDMIEIEYDVVYPTIELEWTELVTTSAAKRAIRRFFKRSERSPHRGRDLIDDVLARELAIYDLTLSQERIDHDLQTITKQYHCSSLSALYLKVLDNKIAPDAVVAALIERELVGYIVQEDGQPLAPPVRIAQTWMQVKEPDKWSRSQRVTPDADIIGKRNTQGVLVVHRKDSPQSPDENDPNVVQLKWSSTTMAREAAEITIEAPPQSFVPAMVLKAIESIGVDVPEQKITIQEFQSKLLDGRISIEMIVDAPDENGLQAVVKQLNTLQRGEYLTSYRMWQLFPGYREAIAGRSDRRQQNPYTLRQVRDSSMFFGRVLEIDQVIDVIEDGATFVVLYGQKRIGKTSMLVHLAESRLPETGNVIPVMADALGLSNFTPAAFLRMLADAAYDTLPSQIDRRGLRYDKRGTHPEPFRQFAQWVAKVERRLNGKRLLFMVDEFTRAEEECSRGRLDKSFFDGMQFLAGSAGVGFVLCIHDHVFNHNSKSWGMLQRGQPVRLGYLERTAARQLIQQPLSRFYNVSDEIVDEILELTNGHPYFIHAICQDIIKVMLQLDVTQIQPDNLHQAVVSIMATGDHYFNHYRNHVDDIAWETLKILAYRTERDQQWATSDAVRSGLNAFGFQYDSRNVAVALNSLIQAQLIEPRGEGQRQATYRIPVRLFWLWLRQVVTHPIVSQDMQRGDKTTS